MSFHGDALVPDAPPPASLAADEELYRSERVIVSRRRLPTTIGSVIVKQARDRQALRGLRHEAAILERLRDIEGVSKLAPGFEASAGDLLILQDDSGIVLSQAQHHASLSLLDRLDIACSLTRVLASVHRAGVIHKDINPSNVLLAGPGRAARLIDFDIASSSTQERLGFTHQNHIAGTLAYMSPEQTGRTGRPIDPRADLYSLGATLYELFTGQRPFHSTELLDLVHDQLANMPPAPAVRVPHIPAALSEIVMRLMEKEPDRRYQAADGLLHDLCRLRQVLAEGGDGASFPLGERDFPERLAPLSRLVGRQEESKVLHEALERMVDGTCLLVGGAPGVGKSALINELRPLITARRGWYVAGKFDQYRQDTPTASLEALRALGRLLLAEPEESLAGHRARIVASLGNNLGFGPSLLPEFELLLGAQKAIEVSDPRQAETRMVQATLGLLRAIASPQRPVVMVLDDVQWAPSISLRLIDAIVSGGTPVPGLLVVAAYRSNQVHQGHPLHSLISRWKELGLAPTHLHLDNLPPAGVTALVGEMLRLPGDEADRLSQVLRERTDGNPFETIELINALRQDGLLVPDRSRWAWDAAAIRRHVGSSGVVDLLGRRIAKLPADTRALLEVLACLGGDVDQDLLHEATGLPVGGIEDQLSPAIEEGLIVQEQGDCTWLRFRHDRVQQAVFECMASSRRNDLHLALACRLSRRGGLEPLAAEQYLASIESLQSADSTERRLAVTLFQQAAARTRALNHAVTERYLCAAVGLLKQLASPQDETLLAFLEHEWHRALYALGRLEEGDTVFASLTTRSAEPLARLDPTCLQLYSLTSRSRYAESLQLGLSLLAELGLHRPADLQPSIAAGLARVASWLADTRRQADFHRPLAEDPRALACAQLLFRVANAAYFYDLPTFAWALLESHRLWVEHGPCAELIASAGAVCYMLVGSPQDYRGAHEVGRHMVAVGDARGFEPATSTVRCNASIAASHWVDPIEDVARAFQRARAELVKAGDMQYAVYTYLSGELLLDSAPQLETARAEMEDGVSSAARSGNRDSLQRYLPRLQLIRALQGDTKRPGIFDDADFNEEEHQQRIGKDNTTSTTFHIMKAVLAAIVGDGAALKLHADAAMPHLARTPGYYVTAITRALHAFSLAEQARGLPIDEREALLGELETGCLAWLTARAVDAPHNFLHLQRWIEAELAWARGRTWAAGEAFDVAMQEASRRCRPWHRALITERAGRFHLQLGMEDTGRPLVAHARNLYEAWGASGKSELLRQEFRFLQSGSSLQRPTGRMHSTITQPDPVDVMAVLRASQTLSSETSLKRLNEALAQILGSMTGASEVNLLVRTDDSQGWLLSSSLGNEGIAESVEQAAARGAVALSVFRYAERTREVLLLSDALQDDRFSHDPHFAEIGQCSLMVVPILSHGQLRAILMLENRLGRDAFSANRLDAVTMIAGQLSVSLDNALLYDSLERKVAARTADLAEANRQLQELSTTDALTGLSNRRRFNDALASEWLRAMRTQSPIGLAVIDIDFFKLYNDHYGHQGGDHCLQEVAQVLATGRRGGSDLVARYGGEEFVILLPDTDLEGTIAVAEAIRTAVERLAQPHAKSPRGMVSISVGVAAMVPDGNTEEARLIELADSALYESKRTGRNRVTPWKPVPQTSAADSPIRTQA